jgi:hypothetical protein
VLTVRLEQMRVLEGAFRASLRAAAAAELVRRGCDGPHDARIDAAEARIDAYRGDPRHDLVRFLLLESELGADFDSRLEWAREILDDEDVPPESKLDVLEIHALHLRGGAR